MRLTPSPDLIHALTMGITDSLTYHHFGLSHFRQAMTESPSGGFIAVTWHQDLLLLLGSLHGRAKVAALTSRSGDGTLIADHLVRRGIRVVRGSSHRGAATAAKELMAAIRDGWILAIAIDGPRGPFRVPKSGPLEIARGAGVPVVPVAARATTELHAPSWDRFRVPMPRAHVAMVVGKPIIYPPAEPSPELLAQRVRAVAMAINALDAQAAARCGRRDCYPPLNRLAWLNRRPSHPG